MPSSGRVRGRENVSQLCGLEDEISSAGSRNGRQMFQPVATLIRFFQDDADPGRELER